MYTNTKEWLNRGYYIDTEIKCLLEEKKQAELNAQGYNVIYDERARTSKTNNQENKYIKILEYTEKIDNITAKLYKIKGEILTVIKNVPETNFRCLLTLRYLQFKKWSDIADEMHYSEVWVRTELHNRALKEVSKYIKQDSVLQ